MRTRAFAALTAAACLFATVGVSADFYIVRTRPWLCSCEALLDYWAPEYGGTIGEWMQWSYCILLGWDVPGILECLGYAVN